MRYKPKNSAALHIALGGLPALMAVKVDADIEVSAKTVGELRKLTDWPEKFGDNDAAGCLSGQRGESEQGKRCGTHIAEVVAPSVISRC